MKPHLKNHDEIKRLCEEAQENLKLLRFKKLTAVCEGALGDPAEHTPYIVEALNHLVQVVNAFIALELARRVAPGCLSDDLRLALMKLEEYE